MFGPKLLQVGREAPPADTAPVQDADTEMQVDAQSEEMPVDREPQPPADEQPEECKMPITGRMVQSWGPSPAR